MELRSGGELCTTGDTNNGGWTSFGKMGATYTSCIRSSGPSLVLEECSEHDKRVNNLVTRPTVDAGQFTTKAQRIVGHIPLKPKFLRFVRHPEEEQLSAIAPIGYQANLTRRTLQNR